MLAQRDPNQVYRRIDFDARISTADPRELVKVCYEQVISGINSAMIAQDRGDNYMKSQALTRAVSALTALQMGVSGESSMADALMTLYMAARKSVLNSVLDFDPETLGRIRADFIEISQALTQSAH